MKYFRTLYTVRCKHCTNMFIALVKHAAVGLMVHLNHFVLVSARKHVLVNCPLMRFFFLVETDSWWLSNLC